MAINYFGVYRSPNIGLFLKANDHFVLTPLGMAPTKVNLLASQLNVRPIRVSMAGSRLLGPLTVLNGRGIIVSRMAWREEVDILTRGTGLPVSLLPDKYTAVGNLVVANDKGAIVSEVLSKAAVKSVGDLLDVPVEVRRVASYHQVGAVVVATNGGALIHPASSEEEVSFLQDVLKVPVEPATINGGVPILASGIVANSKNAVVGRLTSGPELAIISRALGV